MSIKLYNRPPEFAGAILVDVDAALARLEKYASYLLGATELALICDIKVGTIHARTWHDKHMPKPMAKLTMGNVYDKPTVRAWIEKQRLVPNVQVPAKEANDKTI